MERVRDSQVIEYKGKLRCHLNLSQVKWEGQVPNCEISLIASHLVSQ
jgi:hypothetical protein